MTLEEKVIDRLLTADLKKSAANYSALQEAKRAAAQRELDEQAALEAFLK